MTPQEAQSIVLEAIGGIAPEADLAAIDPDEDLREQLDLDSMDFLNFALAIAQSAGIDIPERDYPRMSTLARCVAYLTAAPAKAG